MELQAKLLSNTRTFLSEEKPLHSSNEYQELIKILQFHEHQYYVKDNPLISDKEYDTLFKKLVHYENTNPDNIKSFSPTQRVGSDLTGTLDSVEHIVPMLSLANSYNLEDLQDWEASIRRYLNISPDHSIEFAVEPKYDGGSVAVVYKDNIFKRAATRGNGTLGEDITANIKTLPSIPLTANFKSLNISEVEIRGEALIRKDRFEKINKERQEAQLSIFANPRNAATGALRMKNPQETADRKLDLFAYQIGYAVDSEGNSVLPNFKGHFEAVETLKELGFLTPDLHMKKCKSIEEVATFCQEMERQRPNLPYELDGMVVKVNNINLQDRLGSTAHHPRWAIAYKFAAQQATSTLQAVDFQVGKVGSVTPVARIQPVALAGVTVSNISLHNENFIRDKDIRIGDQVLIERAGDVIPYIVKSLPEYRKGNETEIHWPTNCPECQQPIVRPEGEARWLCINTTCPAQVVTKLIFFSSKHAMDIDGLGDKQIQKFYDLGWLRSFSDIYRLPYDKILELEGYKETSVNNLKKAIESSKSRPIQHLIAGLSIHHVGKKASKLLAQEIKDIRDLCQWDIDQIKAIHGLGDKIALNISEWFNHEENKALLEDLAQLGVNMTQLSEDQVTKTSEDAPLYNKTILFTGTLTKMGRKEAQELAEKNGAKNVSSVSKNLNILVAGEKAGSKLKKASAIPTIQILSENDFLALIQN